MVYEDYYQGFEWGLCARGSKLFWFCFWAKVRLAITLLDLVNMIVMSQLEMQVYVRLGI